METASPAGRAGFPGRANPPPCRQRPPNTPPPPPPRAPPSPGPAIPPPLLQAPPNPSAHHARKGSARKSPNRREANTTRVPATSNAGRGQFQAELLIAWAKQAGGTLNLSQFRAANEGRTRVIKHSFYTTTMYTKVGKLTEQGVFTKIGPGEYRLNDGRG